jgi:biofilm PGA synthesis N-glycosyltransferase PgaC
MSITVGICAYNEDRNIGHLIRNILNEQCLPPNSEIFAVCSGCTDNTIGIVRKYSKKDNRVKLIVEEERNGKASAINKILANAKGNAIIFISADTMPHTACFSQLISRLEDPTVGLVCAKPSPMENPNSPTGSTAQILWNLHDQVFSRLSSKGLAKHASEAFCIRNHIVDKIPDATVNDDAYIAITAKKLGWKVEYEPAACVAISGPETIQDYIRQRRRVIYGHHQIRKWTGESTQYFTSLLHPRSSGLASSLYSIITQYNMFKLLTFLSIELISNIVAASDVLFQKSHRKWSVATSTKRSPKPPHRIS